MTTAVQFTEFFTEEVVPLLTSGGMHPFLVATLALLAPGAWWTLRRVHWRELLQALLRYLLRVLDGKKVGRKLRKPKSARVGGSSRAPAQATDVGARRKRSNVATAPKRRGEPEAGSGS